MNPNNTLYHFSSIYGDDTIICSDTVTHAWEMLRNHRGKDFAEKDWQLNGIRRIAPGVMFDIFNNSY